MLHGVLPLVLPMLMNVKLLVARWTNNMSKYLIDLSLGSFVSFHAYEKGRVVIDGGELM